MKEIAPFDSGFAYTSEFGEGLTVVYSYTERDPVITDTTIAYSYTDGSSDQSRVTGRRVGATQQIMNNLPHWMEMRLKHNSLGQRLTQAWAGNLEGAFEAYNDYRTDEFLATANVYPDVHLGVAEISFSDDRVYEPAFRNILFNSSFSMLAASRLQKPEGWNVSRNVLDALKFSTDHSLFGNRCLFLDGLEGSVDLKQSRDIIIPGGSLALSIYVRTDDNGRSTTATLDATEAGIILVVEYNDATVTTYGVGFPENTGGSWHRAALTATLDREVHSVTAMIVNRTDHQFYVDLPLLETGKKPTTWTPSSVDLPIYIESGTREVTGVQALADAEDGERVTKIEILPISTEGEFRDIRVPTRIEPFSPQRDPNNTVNLTLGRQVDFSRNSFPTLWTADSNQILEKSVLTNDRYISVLPADLSMDEFGDLFLDMTLVDNPDSILVKGTVVVDNLLYVVTKEAYAGKTAYYLKFVRIDKNFYEDTFVESLADVELPLELGLKFGLGSTAEEVSRIGICKNIPDCIFIDTDLDRRFYFKLIYDYYFADLSTRKLYCRQNYQATNAHLQVI